MLEGSHSDEQGTPGTSGAPLGPGLNVGRLGRQTPPGRYLLQTTHGIKECLLLLFFFFPESLGLGNLEADTTAPLLLSSLFGVVKIIKSPVQDLT